jgi:hypothetical protein
MSVKLAHLKSGENIISDIQELVVGETEENQKVVGYLFIKPQVVLLKDFETISKNDEEKLKHSFDINLLPWIPFTKDEKIPVPSEWVVTIVEPLSKLKKMYEKSILKMGEQNDQIDFTNEQSDSGVTD